MSKLILVILSILTFGIILIATVSVNVCHHTGSATNPYNLITVSVHSVDDARGLNGHGDHPEDAWLSFVFDGVEYPGQNTGLFGTVINNDCSLIVPTPTPTNTEIPTMTFTPTPSNTPTLPPTSTNTPTNTPTDTPTKDPNTPTYTPTGTQLPTNTPTSTVPPTSTSFPTSTPIVPTETPRPPIPAMSNSHDEYEGKFLGVIYMDGHSYGLYQGVKAPNGTLALPSEKRGAALYDDTIWVHRAWNSGWINLKIGDKVVIIRDKKFFYYEITDTGELPYGIYPDNNHMYIATCMSNNGETWTNVELFTLTLDEVRSK